MVECILCGKELELEVLRSAAGYYLGHFCSNCGPYDRVSEGYYKCKEDADIDLDLATN